MNRSWKKGVALASQVRERNGVFTTFVPRQSEGRRVAIPNEVLESPPSPHAMVLKIKIQSGKEQPAP